MSPVEPSNTVRASDASQTAGRSILSNARRRRNEGMDLAGQTCTELVLVAVACTSVLSGCGNLSPAETGHAPDSAPQVEQPIDLSQYAGEKKCSVLSKEALTTVGIGGSATVNDFGICMWDGGSVGLAMNPKKGLSSTYELRAKGKFGEFKPGSIKSYPIVATSGSRSKQTFCTVHVGVSNTASFAVSVGDIGSFEDACNAGKDLAASAIDKLKAS